MPTCCRCGESHERAGQRHCLRCHAAYMCDWRKDTKLSPMQRAKDNCRSYANVYKKRGKIIRQGCVVCGSDAEMHHADYSKPLDVTWLCRRHHLQLHREEVHT